MPNKNVDLELIWKEINKHQKILEKMITVLEELRAEIDEIKASLRQKLS